MKLYSAKSSVKRAAKKEGLTEDQYEIIEQDGKFGYKLITVIGEFVHCPNCGIHLENGARDNAEDWAEFLQGGLIQTPKEKENYIQIMLATKHQFHCLGCGEDFGPSTKLTLPAKKAPVKNIPQVNKSSIERPTKAVWDIAEELTEKDPSIRRKDVIAECVARGIAYYTARTQYQQWLTATRNSK